MKPQATERSSPVPQTPNFKTQPQTSKPKPMPDRTQAPSTKLQLDIPYIKPQATVLGNGLPVYFIEGGSEEFVKVELVFLAGSYFQNKPLQAFAVMRLLRAGTETRSREEINELLDYYSAHLAVDPQKDISSISLYVLNKHLKPALDLFRELLQYPAFPADEMRTFLRNQQQMHLINQKKVQHLARTYFNELIYGEQHPYGYRVKAEDFDSLEAEDLHKFHHSYIHAGDAFCVVAGRMPDSMGQLLSDAFGHEQWKGDEIRDTPKFPALSPCRRKVHLEIPDALQSGIRVGKQLFNRTHPAYHRLKIANALLGGYFGSRLMQNIRQDKGYTYGIASNLISLVRSGYFFITTQAGVDVTEATREEIYQELKKLREQPAKEEELSSLKSYLSGSFLRSFDGPFAQSDRFKELLVFGMDHSHYDEYLDTLKTISAEDIMESASLYLREDDMMEVIAGRPY